MLQEALVNNDHTYSSACTALISSPTGPTSNYIFGIFTSALAANNTYGNSTTGGYFSYFVPPSFGSPNSGPLNGSVTASSSGQLVYYFKEVWGPFGTPNLATLPDHIDLLLKTNVQATASLNYNSLVMPGGLTATATTSDGSPYNETASADGSNPATGPGTVTGSHLVQAAVDPGTHIAEVFLNGTGTYTTVDTVSYQASSSGASAGGPTAAHAAGLVSASVIKDSREVSITSSDVETSYFKGLVDDTHSTGQWQHLRGTDGSLVTDSAVSPPLTQPGGGTSWTAGAEMLGQAGGFTNPVFAWSLTGDGTLSASGNTSHTQLSVNFPVLATAAPLGKQSTVRLDVTDSDNATAANTFGVRWHYPYENWQTSGAQFQNSPIAFPSTGPARMNGQVSIPMTANEAGITFNIAGKVLGGLLTAGGAMVAIAQPETDPLIIGFVASTGYTLSVLDPPPTPQPYIEKGTPGQFQGDVATQMAINHGSTAGIFLPARPRMNPGLAAAINAAGNYGSYTGDIGGSLTFDCTAYEEQMQQNYTGDSYGQHGYLGPAAGSIVFPGLWQYVWNWSWTPTVAPASS